MKKSIISISTIPNSLHPALGPKYKVSFTGGIVKEIYAEWFFDLTDFYPNKPSTLLGLKVSEEWINQF